MSNLNNTANPSYKSGSELQQEEKQNQLIYQKNLTKFTDTNKNSHPLVVLSPFQLEAMSALSKQRKAHYLQHIQQLINQVIDDKQSGKNLIPLSEKQYPPLNIPCLDKDKMDILNQQICKQCKGRCCLNGGDTAYLKAETVKRYMTIYPQLSAKQALQNYQKVISEKTHLKSCINHTDTGCNLPTEMRSDMCNHFYCSTLKEFNLSFSKKEMLPTGAVVISRA